MKHPPSTQYNIIIYNKSVDWLTESNGCISGSFKINDYHKTNYLKIYQTDLRQIFRAGRTMAVDDRSEISFLIPQGTLLWQPVSVGFIHRTNRWTQAASDVAGRVNVRLCPHVVYSWPLRCQSDGDDGVVGSWYSCCPLRRPLPQCCCLQGMPPALRYCNTHPQVK